MRITLDGSQCENLNPTTIAEAIEGGCERAHQLGRVVVQIDVDDRTVDPSELGDPEFTTGTADAVALTSLEPSEVLVVSLDLGRKAIEAANEQFGLAARALQAGDTAAATPLLQEGLELWQTLDEHVLREAVPTILANAPGAPTTEVFGSLVGELETALKTIKQAIAAGDFTALSDCLLYEFPETTGRWNDFLTKCSEALGEGKSDTTEGNS
jgi:hypothetical protein